MFSWPQGEDEKYCRAHIVNLDLNNPLGRVYQKMAVLSSQFWLGYANFASYIPGLPEMIGPYV